MSLQLDMMQQPIEVSAPLVDLARILASDNAIKGEIEGRLRIALEAAEIFQPCLDPACGKQGFTQMVISQFVVRLQVDDIEEMLCRPVPLFPAEVDNPQIEMRLPMAGRQNKRADNTP